MAQDKGGAKGSPAKATPTSPRKKRRDTYTQVTDKRIATTAAGLSTITGNKNKNQIMKVAKSIVARANKMELKGGMKEGTLGKLVTSGARSLAGKSGNAERIKPQLSAFVNSLYKGKGLRSYNRSVKKGEAANPAQHTAYEGSAYAGNTGKKGVRRGGKAAESALAKRAWGGRKSTKAKATSKRKK